MEINGHKFQAFVDTGAQSTIVSLDFAKRANIAKDIDNRFQGVAIGVGQTKIVGRIHAAKIRIDGRATVECSLQVLDHLDMGFLLGIDMLKKHRVAFENVNLQCQIDFFTNTIKFPNENNLVVEFVKDHLIERESRKAQQAISSSGFFSEGPEPSYQEKEKRIKLLMDLGASRVQAESVLKRCNWNPELAAGVFIDSRR